MEETSTNAPGAEPVPAAEPHHAGWRTIFVGPSGMRAGWRLLVYLVITVAIAAALGFALHRVDVRFAPFRVVLFDGVVFVAMLAASLIMGAFEHRSLGDYGLPARGAFGLRFWEGVLWGFVSLSIVLLAIAAAGDLDFGRAALHGRLLAAYAAAWGLAFLLVGFAEEYMLRGYAQFTLTTGMGFWPAAVLLSVVFAGMHAGNPGESPLGLIAVVLIALFFCLTLRRTGSLWFAIGFHASWDWAETFFYGVPDSGMVAPGHFLSPTIHGSRWITGGATGPEASVFTVALIGVMFLLLSLRFRTALYPRTQQPAIPAQVTPNQQAEPPSLA